MNRNSLTVTLASLIFVATNVCAQSPLSPGNSGLSAAEYQEIVSQTDFQARSLSVIEFLEKRDLENTVVIDFRSQNAFDHSHIVGAIRMSINFTLADLQKAVPDSNSTVLIYCSNSLIPTRMISLTYVALPQFAAHGYNNAYMLADYFDRGGDRSLIPMTGN